MCRRYLGSVSTVDQYIGNTLWVGQGRSRHTTGVCPVTEGVSCYREALKPGDQVKTSSRSPVWREKVNCRVMCKLMSVRTPGTGIEDVRFIEVREVGGDYFDKGEWCNRTKETLPV